MRNHYTPGTRTPGAVRPRRANGEPDIDEAVVHRLINGDTAVPANWWELDAAIVHLQATGLTTREIAERVGVTRESVLRHHKRRLSLTGGAT